MKKITSIIALSIIALGLACKKDVALNPQPLLASINVVNAATDDYAVFVNPYASGLVYSKQNSQNSPLYLGSSSNYGLPSGNTALKIVSATDTLETLYNETLDLKPAKIYSLFIAGNSAKRESLLIIDEIIPRYTDSAVAVRAVNLSFDGPTVNLAVSGSTLGTGLAYKGKTPFVKIPLNSVRGIEGLKFDIIESSTGNILTSYQLSQYGYPISTTSARFKSLTLVICGSVNATPFSAQGYQVFASPNY